MVEGNRKLGTQIAVRLDDDDYEMIASFASSTGRTVAAVARQLVNRAIAEGEISAADLPEPSVGALLERRRPRTRAEDTAVAMALYDGFVDFSCEVARRDLRDSVLLTAGIGSSLRRMAEQLAEMAGATLEQFEQNTANRPHH